jgi:hypothetical protein
MKRFINKRKKQNRQSLIIDNFNIESLHQKFAQRRNSLSNSQPSHDTLSTVSQYDNNDTYKNNEFNRIKYNDNINFKENENLQDNIIINKPVKMNNQSLKRQECDEHTCNLCYNNQNIKDSFMILTCGHIFHIRCLVDSHYSDANKCGLIDEEFFNSRKCCVCSKQMEIEDILYIHNKFYKNTKEYIIKQDETIEKIDKQMTKLKEELRICYEYKQKLEHQREKSKQITVTINTLM